jgi:hypothetical protein
MRNIKIVLLLVATAFVGLFVLTCNKPENIAAIAIPSIADFKKIKQEEKNYLQQKQHYQQAVRQTAQTITSLTKALQTAQIKNRTLLLQLQLHSKKKKDSATSPLAASLDEIDTLIAINEVKDKLCDSTLAIQQQLLHQQDSMLQQQDKYIQDFKDTRTLTQTAQLKQMKKIKRSRFFWKLCTAVLSAVVVKSALK